MITGQMDKDSHCACKKKCNTDLEIILKYQYIFVCCM